MPCFPSLSELPEPPDAVVVAIPAAGVPRRASTRRARSAAAALWCTAPASARWRRASSSSAAARGGRGATRCPCAARTATGSWRSHARAALWGDALRAARARPVALVSQSGNVAVNALATRRGLRFHTVVSCGNAAVRRTPPTGCARWPATTDVRSIAALPRGRRRRRAALRGAGRVRRARRGRGGAEGGRLRRRRRGRGSRAHRRAGRRPARVPRAGRGGRRGLGGRRARAAGAGQGAGGAGAPARPGGGSLAIAHLLGRRLRARAPTSARDSALELPPSPPATAERLRRAAPRRRHGRQPARLHGADLGRQPSAPRHRSSPSATTRRSTRSSCSTTSRGPDGAPGGSWAAVREGHRAGAAAAATPAVMVSSTLPELLDDDGRLALRRGRASRRVAGLRTGLALRRRAREASAAIPHACARSPPPPAAAARRSNGRPALAGRARGEGAAALGRRARWSRAGSWRARTMRSRRFGARRRRCREAHAPRLQHKSELGAIELAALAPRSVRRAYRRLAELGSAGGAAVLVERMAPPGVELLVAARRDGVVPALVIGLGGSGPSCSTTSRSSRCRRAVRAWNGRCARCAAPRYSPAGAAGRRWIWARS